MNHTLTLRLERLQVGVYFLDLFSISIFKKASRDTVIPMEYSAPSLSLGQSETAQKALTVLDTLTFKFISMLRNYPAARIVVAAYFVLIHLWVFFIILTYTPEMHEDAVTYHNTFPSR